MLIASGVSLKFRNSRSGRSCCPGWFCFSFPLGEQSCLLSPCPSITLPSDFIVSGWVGFCLFLETIKSIGIFEGSDYIQLIMSLLRKGLLGPSCLSSSVHLSKSSLFFVHLVIYSSVNICCTFATCQALRIGDSETMAWALPGKYPRGSYRQPWIPIVLQVD